MKTKSSKKSDDQLPVEVLAEIVKRKNQSSINISDQAAKALLFENITIEFLTNDQFKNQIATASMDIKTNGKAMLLVANAYPLNCLETENIFNENSPSKVKAK